MRWYVLGAGVILSVGGWAATLTGLFGAGDVWSLGRVLASRDLQQDYALALVVIGVGALCIATSESMPRSPLNR